MISNEAHYDHMRMMANEAPCIRLLRDKRVKARKHHECTRCKSMIEPGEFFHCQVWLDEDATPHKIETVKECAGCLARDWSDI